MNFSDKGMAKLKNLEGFKEEAYLDSGGHASIGYGHKIREGEIFGKITEKRAELLLKADFAAIERFINIHLPKIVTQNQFDALVMFIYNIGERAFLNSTVLQDLKGGKYEDATKFWGQWINVSKMVISEETGEVVKKLIPVNGLMKRRAIEIQLFNT